MRTLVTGGAGNIGSHLVEQLLKLGHEVTVLDNLSVGRWSNLKPLSQEKNFRFFETDISTMKRQKALFHGMDWVFHLAALADIVPSITSPKEYHRANVDGTFSVLEASREAGVKRFIYAASSSCYGIPDKYPTAEDAPCRPQYPYALTKYLGEQMVMHWNQVYKLPAVSLRLFNVYGPRSRTNGTYGAVFGVFLAQMFHGAPLTIVGDGEQTRDFTFVYDVVDAFITAAMSNETGIFNVGSGNTYSVNALADLLSPGERRIYLPDRPGEPRATMADVKKITERLGWGACYSFGAGVEIMKETISQYARAPLWTPHAIKEATGDWFKYLGDKNAGLS